MRIALLSTSDTDLLCARAVGADYVLANPARPGHQSMAEVIEGCDLVVGRLLGSPQDLCSGFTRVAATGMPVVVLGGEQSPSAELMELSSVPIGRRGRGPPLPRRGRPGEPHASCTPSSPTRSC